jgi:hypothetical protein
MQFVLAFTALALLVGSPGQTAPQTDQSAAPEQTPQAAVSPSQAVPQNAAGPATKADAPRNPRVLFITAKDSVRCDEELARLRRPGGDFERMQTRGWKIGASAANHLQIVDSDDVPDLIRRLDVRVFPTVACIDDGEIVRSFQEGCTTPLDQWTFGFLAKGIDERPPGMVPEAARAESTGHYPLRGNHWSVEGDWSPTRERVISHLRGPNHGSRISSSWAIEAWSYEELRSLHDNLHEQEGGAPSSVSRASSGSRSSNQFSANRKILGR